MRNTIRESEEDVMKKLFKKVLQKMGYVPMGELTSARQRAEEAQEWAEREGKRREEYSHALEALFRGEECELPPLDGRVDVGYPGPGRELERGETCAVRWEKDLKGRFIYWAHKYPV
jgi:hypothetical protein